MLNITNYQRNASENILVRMTIKKINNSKLERVRRNGTPPTLLVGMQTSTATMENSVEIPLKIANRTTL